MKTGTAEIVFTSGLIWCQAPIGYALSLMLGIIVSHLDRFISITEKYYHKNNSSWYYYIKCYY